jgi:hypothetical protein
MTALQKAFFKVLSGRNQNQEVPVHFNPVSLQYAVNNTLEEQGSGNRKKQHVTQSSGKLTMDLIFDTTHDGSDVRRITDKIAQFMQPDSQNAPPVVEFEWGSYSFKGMVESFKETIDFFAPTGVPLRASVNLTLAQQDTVFEPNNYSQFDQNNSLTPDSVDVPAPFEPANYAQKDVTQLATQSGNPQAGRALAALNSLESMRFPSGAITVPEGIDLRGPVAFSAGISGGSSGGGLGLSLNLGGLASSAGVSASAGAFGKLKTPSSAASVQLDPLRLVPPPAAGLTGDLASFQVGGQTTSPGAGSFKADVGANADLRSRLQFRSG